MTTPNQKLKRLKASKEVNYPVTTHGKRLKKRSALYQRICEQVSALSASHRLPRKMRRTQILEQVLRRLQRHKHPIACPRELQALVEKHFLEVVARMENKKSDAMKKQTPSVQVIGWLVIESCPPAANGSTNGHVH